MEAQTPDFKNEAQGLLRDPDEFEKYVPHDEDYEKVFRQEHVEKARKFFGRTFRDLTPEERKRSLTLHDLDPSRALVRVHAVSPDELRDGDAIEEFDLPDDYSEIGRILRPEVKTLVFVVFQSQEENKRAGFDGFIHVNGHWAWFPKACSLLD